MVYQKGEEVRAGGPVIEAILAVLPDQRPDVARALLDAALAAGAAAEAAGGTYALGAFKGLHAALLEHLKLPDGTLAWEEVRLGLRRRGGGCWLGIQQAAGESALHATLD